MVSYSTNWMGPVATRWYEDRNIPFVMKETSGKILPKREYKEFLESYSGGRIDIRGVPDEPWGLEYGLPIMHTEDWNALSDWLDDFETHELWSFDDIITQYEQERDTKIRWWKDDNDS